MAQRVQIILEDDIDQSPAVETIEFALDGVNYEIDLSAANAKKLRAAFDPWVSAGRKVAGRRGRRPRTQRPFSDATLIREWAKEQGMEVSDRGRIPLEVRAAYEEALKTEN